MNELETAAQTAPEAAEKEHLRALATEINILDRQAGQIMLTYAIEIGRRLAEVKASIPHGSFGKWLSENVSFSERRAQNVIRLYEEYGNGQEKLFGKKIDEQTIGKLNYSQAVALLAIKDEDERAEFVEENDVVNMSKRELEKAIKERNDANEKLDAANKKLDAAEEELDKVKKDLAEMLDEDAGVIEELEVRKKQVEDLTRQLEEAKENGDSELIKQLEAERDSEKKSAEKLKAEIEKLKSEKEAADERTKKQIETTVDAVTKDLEEKFKKESAGLEEENAKLKEKLASASEDDGIKTEFTHYFKLIKDGFNGMVELIEAAPAEKQEQYYHALIKTLETMLNQAKEMSI